MNCDDYLALLSTLPTGEMMGHTRAREHAATCRDCDRVTRVVAERERNMYLAYSDLNSPMAAGQTAATALAASRRRKVGLFYKIGLGVIGAGVVLFFVIMRAVVPAPQATIVKQDIRLQCLSPEQASVLIRPYLESRTGQLSFRPGSPLGIISASGTAEEMEKVHAVIAQFDNAAASQCAVQVRVPEDAGAPVPTPAAARATKTP